MTYKTRRISIEGESQVKEKSLQEKIIIYCEEILGKEYFDTKLARDKGRENKRAIVRSTKRRIKRFNPFAN